MANNNVIIITDSDDEPIHDTDQQKRVAKMKHLTSTLQKQHNSVNGVTSKDELNMWRAKLNPFLFGLDRVDLNGISRDEPNLSKNKQMQTKPLEEDSLLETRNGDPYYLKNFLLVIDTVLGDSGCDNIFQADDRKYCELFKSMSKEAQSLYVRIYQRKKQWFGCSKINYPNIANDLVPYFNELIKNGFLVNNPGVNEISDVISMLGLKEIRMLGSEFHLSNKTNSLSKKELLSLLEKHCAKQKTIFYFATNKQEGMKTRLLKRALSYLGECVKINGDVCFVFTCIFTYFTMTTSHYEDMHYNTGKNVLFQILQADHGNWVYAQYDLQNTSVLFNNRDELVAYTKACVLERQLDDLMEKKDYKKAFKLYADTHESFLVIMERLTNEKRIQSYIRQPYWLRCFGEEWIIIRLYINFVDLLEKQKRHTEAVVLLELLLSQFVFCISSRGKLWERLVIDYERHVKDIRKSKDCIIKSLKDEFVRTGHRYYLQQKLRKCADVDSTLSESLQVIPDPIQETLSAEVFLNTSTVNRTVFRSPLHPETCTYVHVEQYVIDYYNLKGFSHGIHGEVLTMTTLFFLIFWDEVFMCVPDVFYSKYQSSPLDIYRDDFYTNRKIPLTRKLHFLQNASEEELHSLVSSNWKLYHGTLCVLCNWELFHDATHAADLSTCIKRDVLVGICELFCKDLRHRRGGFPDLILWDVETKKCKFIEVKGPGDKLSVKQIVWLSILQSLGADAYACNVKGAGGKRKYIERSAVTSNKKR